MATAIKLPFKFDGYGKVAKTSDLASIIRDRVMTVVSTSPGERVMRPNFGCELPESLFDALSTVPAVVEGKISGALATWVPAVEFEGISVEGEDQQNGDVTVAVNYSIPQLQQEDGNTFSVTI